MRRSPRPGSAASSHNHTPDFFSENSNSSHSVTSGDSNGRRPAGPELEQPEGRRDRGSSCGEPAISPGVPGGDTWDGSSRPCASEPQRPDRLWRGNQPGESPAVLEEPLNLLPALDLRQEMPPTRVSKSFLGLLFQVLSVLLSLAGDALVSVYREVCSIRFLFSSLSLLSIVLAANTISACTPRASSCSSCSRSLINFTRRCPACAQPTVREWPSLCSRG
ncbi:Sperm-associated antigen 4 protein [Lemmus lemmus]